MAKKVEEKVVQTEDLVTDLISGTSFNLIDQNNQGKGSLSDKPKVETPLYALNCLLGGGLPLGAILEVYGPNASGKSSFMYETLGNFQRQYPNGVAFILDTETSTDNSRLRQLGVDPLRAPRMGAATLEDGFEQINKIVSKMVNDDRYKGFPVMILWDTIASAPTRAQVKTGEMYGGGMAERARIIKSALMTIFPLIEQQNILLVLLNQVMAEIGGWKPGLTTAGGNALKHDVHLKLEITGGKTSYDGVYATRKYSELGISKSKISPIMGGFPVTIDITRGGVIDRVESFVWWMTKLDIFKQSAWWSVEETYYERYKDYWDRFKGFYPHFRQAYLYEYAREHPDFVDFLMLVWLDAISDRYVLQKEVVKDMRDQVLARLELPREVTSEDTANFEENLDELSQVLGISEGDASTEGSTTPIDELQSDEESNN